MKKGVIVVNNARGAIMDTQAVADACSSGHIAGTYTALICFLCLFTQQYCYTSYPDSTEEVHEVILVSLSLPCFVFCGFSMKT